MRKRTWFERAIFLSWYCSRGDCSFCYMSTQKHLIKDPKKAVRKKEAILAEAVISKACGWKIEFISGGYGSYPLAEIVDITRILHEITSQKQWLNIGVLTKEEMKQFMPHIKGVCGAVECINPLLHRKVCPSKPVAPIIKMFRDAESLGLKKAITLIIGLGETEKDIPLLIDFIKKHKIDRITFYALNPHKGTPFDKGPEKHYYAGWIMEIRKAFPSLQIIAGSWADRISEISLLLEAGADAITKFPAIKLFGSKPAKQIEEESKKAGKKFEGTMTLLPKIDAKKEADKIQTDEGTKRRARSMIERFIRKMGRHR